MAEREPAAEPLLEGERSDGEDGEEGMPPADATPRSPLSADEGPQPTVRPPPRSPLSRCASMSAISPLPPARREHRSAFVAKTTGWFVGSLLLGILALGGVIALFGTAPDGGIPAARRGAATVVLPLDASRGSAANAKQPRLVVYGGRGQSGFLFRDLFTFGLGANGVWKKVKQQQQQQQQEQQGHVAGTQRRLLGGWLAKPQPRPPLPRPSPRWKAAVAQLGDRGMLLHGGEAPNATAAEAYVGDAWLLGPDLRWQGPIAYNSSEAGGSVPAARRGHSVVPFQDEAGTQSLLLFGGRRNDGLLTCDVWLGALQEGESGSLQIVWTLVHDPQAGVGSGPAPLPRGGHLAAMNGSSSMLIFGGRSDVYGSFADVWQFSVVDRRWTALPPATAAQPAARDYAGGTLVGDQLFVFGGRYGGAPGAAAVSRPIGDRWLFDLQTRTWRQLPVRGLSPLPRFLFSWAHVQMNGSRGPSDQLLIFGGEGGAGCALNDVWMHDLQTLLWVQLSEPRFATPECKRMFT